MALSWDQVRRGAVTGASALGRAVLNIPQGARAISDAVVTRTQQPEIDARNARQREADNALQRAIEQERKRGNTARVQKLQKLQGSGQTKIEDVVGGRPLTTPQEAGNFFGQAASLALGGRVAGGGSAAANTGARTINEANALIAARINSLTPIKRLLAWSALRGTQNAATQLPFDLLANPDDPKRALELAGGNLAGGALVNAVLSPRLLKAGGDEVVERLRLQRIAEELVPILDKNVPTNRIIGRTEGGGNIRSGMMENVEEGTAKELFDAAVGGNGARYITPVNPDAKVAVVTDAFKTGNRLSARVDDPAVAKQLKELRGKKDAKISLFGPEKPTPEVPELKTPNMERMALSEAGKDAITVASDNARPIVDPNRKKVKLAEVVAKSQEAGSDKVKARSREQTLELGATIQRNRNKITKLAEEQKANWEEGRNPESMLELTKRLQDDLLVAADQARLLGQRRIISNPSEASQMEQFIARVLKAGADVEAAAQAAAKVNFDDPIAAARFYRQFVKPTMANWLDTVRYNSMLSSPLTHVVNIASNITSAPVRALTKTVTGGVDFLGSIGGSPQEQFAGEGTAYLKGYLGSVKKAYTTMVEAMKRGPELTAETPDHAIPLAVDGNAGKVYGVLSTPMKLLEGMDQFFKTLSREGEGAALTYRKSKGVKVTNEAKLIEQGSNYGIFRTELGDADQGTVLRAIDSVANLVGQARQSDNPIVSTVARFTFPFLNTPTNILKQGIEYSPLGFTTAIGAKNVDEQLAKSIIGSTVFLGASGLAAAGRLTFGLPNSEKERDLWKKAGVQPYSMKIGSGENARWVSYNKLHPSLAFPLAMVAGFEDAKKKRRITDDDVTVALQTLGNTFEFLFDQSFMKSMGDFLDVAGGNEKAWARVGSNYLQQVVPGRALGGWMARMFDEYERTTSPDAGFWQKQYELLSQNVPGLRGFTPARIAPDGTPIPAQNPFLNNVSPLKFTTENPEGKQALEEYQAESQVNRNVDAIREQVRNEVEGDLMRSATGAQAAETAPLQGVEERNGLFVYRASDGAITVNKDRAKVEDAAARDQVRSTGKNVEIGDFVYRLKDGEVQKVDLKKVQESVDKKARTEAVSAAKKAGDYNTWKKYKEEDYTALEEKLAGLDERLDAAAIIDTKKAMQAILNEVLPYERGEKKFKAAGSSKKKTKKAPKRAAITTRRPRPKAAPKVKLAKVAALPRISTPRVSVPNLSVNKKKAAKVKKVR